MKNTGKKIRDILDNNLINGFRGWNVLLSITWLIILLGGIFFNSNLSSFQIIALGVFSLIILLQLLIIKFLRQSLLKNNTHISDLYQANESLHKTETMYHQLVDGIRIVIYVEYSQPDLQSFISPQIVLMLGYSLEEWKNDRDFKNKVIYFEDREKILELRQQVVYNGGYFQAEYRMTSKDDRIVWVHEEASQIYEKNWNLVGWHGIIVDISQSKKLEADLIRREKYYRTLVENQGEGICYVDQNAVFTFTNPAAEKIFGVEPGGLLGMNLYDFMAPEQKDIILERTRPRSREAKSCHEFDIFQKNGDRKTILFTSTSQYDHMGRSLGFLGVIRDITERKSEENTLQFLSIHDILTGVYNRNFFEREIIRLDENRNFPVSILVADLDRLKMVNDSQGHAVGDEIIKEAANILKSLYRSEDVIARIGGDEFVVLMPGVDDQAAVDTLRRIRKFRNQLGCDPAAPNERNFSFSLGVATAQPGESLREAFIRADEAMYKDKRRLTLHHIHSN